MNAAILPAPATAGSSPTVDEIRQGTRGIDIGAVAGRYRADVTGDAPFQMTVDPSANTVRLRLTGEIDIAVTAELGDVLEAALADRPDSVEIDFAGVTFMDSTGIRFLVGFKNRCDAIGASWALVNVSPSIIRLIDLSGLRDFLRPPE